MSQLTVDIGPRDHIQGNKAAPVTLLEYGDYECPYCGQAYWIVKRLEQEKGYEMRFAYRNFPLTEVHPHALQAALAAEAAGGQGAFWPMHDLLFEHQDALDEQSILTYASTLNLDLDQFANDMGAEETTERVREDFMSGVHSGVNGTPTFFINGRRFNHWFEYEALREAIDAAAGAVRR